MEERILRQTCQFVQDKVLFLGKLEKRLASIYTFYLLFFCFLVNRKYYLVDRISNLPDELVASILSFLPLKEAVATSILSRRWRYVWTSTTRLDFDAVASLHGFVNLRREFQDRKRRSYVNWVDCVVKQHTGHKIEKFRACFDLDDCFTSSIDKWIQLAMEKSVQVLELDFVMKYGTLYEDSYVFPHKLLGLEKGCPSNHYIGFKSLKVLCFESVDVTGEVVEYFLSHCPVLERLSLSYAKSFETLRVVGPSVRLKYLLIKFCFELKTIEIRDTNLVSFIHIGMFIDVHLSNVPCLVEAYMSCPGNDDNADYISLAFTQLSCCVSQLETLMLDIYDVKYSENHVFPILPNLKHLELAVFGDYEWGLSHLSSLMKASPYLQKLVLKFIEFEWRDQKTIKKGAKCPHHNLKVVELVGYRARANAVEHAMFLIENAVGLEKIVIDPVHPSSHHTGAEATRKDKKVERKARRHAMQQLKKKVPSTIEFVCL